MQVPLFTHQELLTFLKANGWSVCSDQYWEKFDRLILKKEAHTFPLQIKERYLFTFVVKLCNSLGIDPPADHKKNFDQLTAMRMREMAKRLERERERDDN